MATPEIEPGWFSVAWQWIAGIGAAIWGVWKFIDAKINKTNEHIEQLYKNAEADRKLTRDLHDVAMRSISDMKTEVIGAMRNRR